VTVSSVECEWKPWMMIDEHVVAQMTGLAVKTLQNERAAGRGIPCTKMNGKSIRYRVSDVYAWIASRPSGIRDVPIDRRRRKVAPK